MTIRFQQLVDETPEDQLITLIGELDVAILRVKDRMRAETSVVVQESDADELLTMEQVAEYLKIDVDTAREWGRTGRLPIMKLGERGIRVRRGTLRQWVRSMEGVRRKK